MTSITFIHPEPPVMTTAVWPVFLPFAGCPFRCLYCAQEKQTGRGSVDLEAALHNLESGLESALEAGRGPYELGLYGGTFTALPDPWPIRFLEVASRYRKAGLIRGVRCSTRPDCLSLPLLADLRSRGLDMIELGIQSFDDTALAASGRGYDGGCAEKGCETVLESGLDLGVQLLPGLPGDHPGLFQKDVLKTASLGPKTARFYPCLVIKGTPLEGIWERGAYTPWGLDQAVQELSEALPVMWDRGVHVIRMGVAQEPGLDGQILAGPQHPALGQRARAWALFRIIEERCVGLDQPPTGFDVPRRYQGELFGHAGELLEQYRSLGLHKHIIRYVDGTQFSLF